MNKMTFRYYFILLLAAGFWLYGVNGWSSVTYYHSDHLGSSNVLSDSDGSVSGETQYYPYGSTFSESMSGFTSYKYTDKEEDDETNLYYYGARYYDTVLTRFLSSDPILFGNLSETVRKNPGMINAYSYAGNNPITKIDINGQVEGSTNIPSAKAAQFAIFNNLKRFRRGEGHPQAAFTNLSFYHDANMSPPKNPSDAKGHTWMSYRGNDQFSVITPVDNTHSIACTTPDGKTTTFAYEGGPVQFFYGGIILGTDPKTGKEIEKGYVYYGSPTNMHAGIKVGKWEIGNSHVETSIVIFEDDDFYSYATTDAPDLFIVRGSIVAGRPELPPDEIKWGSKGKDTLKSIEGLAKKYKMTLFGKDFSPSAYSENPESYWNQSSQ